MNGKSIKSSLIKTVIYIVLIFALIIAQAPSVFAQSAQWYTQFQGYGSAQYRVAPPSGPGVSGMFNLVRNATNDPNYSNVVILTYEAEYVSGAAWARQKLDMTKSFTIESYVQLYHKQGFVTNRENEAYRNGGLADGLTFTLQNDNAYANNNATPGGLLGVYGNINGSNHIKRALTIEMDTRPQTTVDTGTGMVDPANGSMSHIALLTPKSAWIYQSDHKNTDFFYATEKWYPLNISWTPAGVGGILNYQFDGRYYSYYVNSCYEQFGGTEVYWGFTAATGWGSAVHAVAMKTFPEQQQNVVVSYNPNGGVGSINNFNVIQNSYYTVANQDYYRNGYVFNGWNTSPDGSGNKYSNGQQIYVTGNITLYAQWINQVSYMAIYQPNGGEGSIVFDTTNDKMQVTIRGDTFKRTGYTFKGWNTMPNGSGVSYNPGQAVTLNDHLLLFAQWQADIIYLWYPY